MDRKIKVIVAKVGLDGHDRGAKMVSHALRDSGMEVIYSGLHQTPDAIVSAAVQEDVDVIGLSILSGSHRTLVFRTMALIRDNGMEDVVVLVGGIIPDEDVDVLIREGVDAVFGPGADTDAIAGLIKDKVAGKRSQ